MSANALSIAVAQPPCRALDVAANAAAHAEAVRSAAARVVLFPELSLTGYEHDADPVAPDDPRLRALEDACAELGSIALVGAPTAAAGGLKHISMLAVGGGWVRLAYNKLHLGGSEPATFAAGPGPVAIEVDGWRLGLAICKDTGVVEHAVATAALGIDAYLAGVCELAEDDEEKDWRAHRISTEHEVWVAVASFAGPTGEGFSSTAGRSTIWAPGGSVVARAGAEPGEVARATITRG